MDSDAQARFCRELGFSLFQGYYFAKPAIIAGKQLSHSELSLIRLLGLLLDEADTPQLEAVFKQEPGLTPCAAAAAQGVKPRSVMSSTISSRRTKVSRAFLCVFIRLIS